MNSYWHPIESRKEALDNDERGNQTPDDNEESLTDEESSAGHPSGPSEDTDGKLESRQAKVIDKRYGERYQSAGTKQSHHDQRKGVIHFANANRSESEQLRIRGLLTAMLPPGSETFNLKSAID